MASFQREKELVGHLLRRLHLGSVSVCDPNADGSETGMDVLVHLPDGRVVGIQVTEVDPHTEPGTARAEEKGIAGTDRNSVYCGWGQNNPQLVLESLVRTIRRKVKIAAQHSFESIDEVWLLVCGGIPEHGGAISTSVITPWLSAAEVGQVTDHLLQGSKYDCCFFLPILGVEEAFYGWEENRGWKKSVKLNDLRQTPRAAYVNRLHLAAASDWQEVDRLCDEECKIVLSENREP